MKALSICRRALLSPGHRVDRSPGSSWKCEAVRSMRAAWSCAQYEETFRPRTEAHDNLRHSLHRADDCHAPVVAADCHNERLPWRRSLGDPAGGNCQRGLPGIEWRFAVVCLSDGAPEVR